MEKSSILSKVKSGASNFLRIRACDNRKCLVCGRPLRYTDKTGEQVVLYHPECRVQRHNRRARGR